MVSLAQPIAAPSVTGTDQDLIGCLGWSVRTSRIPRTLRAIWSQFLGVLARHISGANEQHCKSHLLAVSKSRITYNRSIAGPPRVKRNMPCLSLPGVNILYETLGSGPLLLCITCADGRGSVWKPLAQELSEHHTVAYYDRRGFSGSIITGAQDYSDRLNTDADDAASLIAHLSPDAGATVVGNSSGAIVGLNLLLKYPARVLNLVCHEPPAFGALPPHVQAMGAGTVNHIHDVYTKSGPIAAMDAFVGGLAVTKEGALMQSLMHPGHSHEIRANAQFWFQFELRQYPTSKVDVAGLIALKDKFVPAAGTDSGDEVSVAPIASIASAMGKDIIRLPGGHLGFISEPKAWARGLLMSTGRD